jgi:hypothetical protein
MVLDNHGGKTIPFDKDTLTTPEVVITYFGSDIPKILKDTFDIIWNSVGERMSICYDKDGNRMEPKPRFY